MKHGTLVMSALLVLVCSATPAMGAPADDVRQGSNVYLRWGTARLEGQDYNGSNYLVSKAPGSLDLRVSPRDFGFDIDDVITLYGYASDRGDKIEWSLNHTPAVPYDLGGGVALTYLQGYLTTEASYLAGDASRSCGATPCDYNVRVRASGGGYLYARGTAPFPVLNWERWIEVRDGEITGGLPTPSLASLTVSAPARLCASPGSRTLSAEARLRSPAPSAGAWVDVNTGLPGATTQRLRVAPGARSVSFPLRIPAYTEGLFLVTASSGGATSQATLRVRPESECESSGVAIVFPKFRDLLPQDLLGDCLACLKSSRINRRGDIVGLYQKGAFLYSPDRGLVLVNELLQAEATPVGLDDLGNALFTAPGKEGMRTFVLAPGDEKEPVVVKAVEGIEAIAPSHYGTFLGRDVNGQLAVWNGSNVQPLKLPEEVNFAAADAEGYVFVGSSKHGPLRFDFEKWNELDPGGPAWQPQHVAPSGHLVGNGSNQNGQKSAFLFSPDKGTRELPWPKGAAAVEAVGVSSAGWVVGHYTTYKGGQRAFLYTPKEGSVDLQSLMPQDAKVQIREVLQITDGDEVVVRGLRDGKAGFWVLSASEVNP